MRPDDAPIGPTRGGNPAKSGQAATVLRNDGLPAARSSRYASDLPADQSHRRSGTSPIKRARLSASSRAPRWSPPSAATEHWELDTLSFGISALILMTAVRAQPAAQRTTGKRPTMWSVSAGGVRIVFGDPTLRTQLLFGGWPGSTSFPGARRTARALARRHGGHRRLLMAAVACCAARSSPTSALTAPGRYVRRLLMSDSRIEPPSSPSSGRIIQAMRYSRMPSP